LDGLSHAQLSLTPFPVLTERVVRSGDEKTFSARYAPQKWPVMVKLPQSAGGNWELQLMSYKQP
jgi:hypothetical protein